MTNLQSVAHIQAGEIEVHIFNDMDTPWNDRTWHYDFYIEPMDEDGGMGIDVTRELTIPEINAIAFAIWNAWKYGVKCGKLRVQRDIRAALGV